MGLNWIRFGVGSTVDADYKSSSGNFQALQQAANDHSAVARIDAAEIYPLPSVKKEIELLKFANRRSTRTARIEAFKSAADQQTARNAVSSGIQGGARTSTYTGWLQIFWNGLTQPTKSEPKACVSVSDSASGSNFGGCK